MHLSKIPALLLSIFTLLTFSDCWSQSLETVKDADIHEAFVTRSGGTILIDAHPKQPPGRINEKIPKQTDSSTTWIPGYWSWDEDLNDYVWTTGVWRRPPPGRTWIEGFWEEFDDGWAWIPGFWSDKDLFELVYVDLAPPEAVDEDTSNSPGDSYFWNPGFWWYNSSKDEYEWVDGQWEELDPNWVLIPAHYTWRPEGYTLIEAYWDWPIDSLGEAYETIYIAPSHRESITYEPVQVLETTRIIDHYFYSYPDHTSFYYHHFHYHPYYWESYCCAPQWWLWDNWWGLSWNNQWGLWWWYSNPGYPAPYWISGNISSILPPPRPLLHRRMKRVRPPRFITPNGIVSPHTILKENQRITGRRKPILPPNRRDLDKIWKGVNPEGNREIKPHGRPRPFNPNIKRPSPPRPSIDREPGRRIPRVPEARIPRIPKRPEARPDIRKPRPDGKRPSGPRPGFDRPDGKRPDFNRPPTTRPPKPRPEFERPDGKRPGFDRPDGKRPNFNRPPTTRPPKPRPEFERPDGKRPGFDRPDGKRPDFNRPQTARPPKPRPEFERPDGKRPDFDRPDGKRPDFNRPPTTRPPKPDYNRPDRGRPESRKPRTPDVNKTAPPRSEINPPAQPQIRYPKGFHEKPPEQQRTRSEPKARVRQYRRQRASEIKKENRQPKESRKERKQESKRDRQDRDNDDD